MARVVQQRRSKPPYLLVVFVFLTLVAATVAIIFGMQKSRLDEENAELTEENDLYATGDLQRSEDLQARLQAARQKPDVTVVGSMLEDLRQLAEDITAQRASVAEAHRAAREAQRKLEDAHGVQTTGLAPAVGNLLGALADARAKLQDTTTELNKLQRQYAALEDTFAEATQNLTAEKEQLGKQLEQSQKARDDLEDEWRTRLEEAQAKFKEDLADFQKQLSARAEEIQDLQGTITEKDLEIATLRQKVIEATRTDEPGLAVRASGRIYGDVLHQQKLCMIDIGRKQGVRAGLRFSVFAPGKLPERAARGAGEPRGRIKVLQPRSLVSECQILWEDAENPIEAGDPVVNLAFAPDRNLVFRVAGWFDVQHTGQPSQAGADEIKAMIERAGSTVADTVNFETSYLVRGERPDVPPEPAEDAPLQVWQVYRQQKKAADAYEQALNRAQEMDVEMLTLGKLLDLIGREQSRSASR